MEILKIFNQQNSKNWLGIVDDDTLLRYCYCRLQDRFSKPKLQYPTVAKSARMLQFRKWFRNGAGGAVRVRV